MWGTFGKPLKRHPGSACCADDMFEIFVRFGRCLCCLLPPFVNRQPPCPHTNSLYRLLLPPMYHKSLLVRKRARSGGAEWVQVARHRPGSQAKKPCTAASQRHGAMPLNAGWVPVKARRLQDWGKVKKYVPIHKQGDVCPNGVPALVERGNNEDEADSV